jgi:arginyl-tRNA synthetase
MKLDINKIKIVPKNITNVFTLCVYGNLEDSNNSEVNDWIKFNNFSTEKNDNYVNIIIPNVDLSTIFNSPKEFQYLDGFSPNLNKKLHIGHFSNLVLGKAFKSLGICKNIVSIYGDTLSGEVSKEDAINALHKYQELFEFIPDIEYFASEMKVNTTTLYDGLGDYSGTKVFYPMSFSSGKAFSPIVGIKSDGSTSYFYQDVALSEKLNAPTLYLTGLEQNNHFEALKTIFPHIQHVGLGLVKLTEGKMSSRLGNVIFIEDFINNLLEIFNNDYKLIYNVFAGFILKSNTFVDKNINLELINNAKNSAGLYLSYTMARLHSAGCELKTNNKFNSKYLEFALLRAQFELNPKILFEELVDLCKDINILYMTHHIKDNNENKIMFEEKLSDLIHGCKLLGLFIIDKV